MFELVSKSSVLLGLLLCCGVIAVVIGRVNGLLSDDLFGVVVVALVMVAIGGFSKQFLKLFNPGLGNITNDLQSHLTKIGVGYEILDPKDPKAIKHRSHMLGNDPLYFPLWGVVRIKDRNVDFIELRARVIPGSRSDSIISRDMDATAVWYTCAVQGNITNEEDFQASTKGGNALWSGGLLAEVLNADSELQTMLTSLNNPPIVVRGVKSDGYVAIYKGVLTLSGGSMVPTYGMGDYPSSDEFNMYDRIARDVKELLG